MPLSSVLNHDLQESLLMDETGVNETDVWLVRHGERIDETDDARVHIT